MLVSNEEIPPMREREVNLSKIKNNGKQF